MLRLDYHDQKDPPRSVAPEKLKDFESFQDAVRDSEAYFRIWSTDMQMRILRVLNAAFLLLRLAPSE